MINKDVVVVNLTGVAVKAGGGAVKAVYFEAGSASVPLPSTTFPCVVSYSQWLCPYHQSNIFPFVVLDPNADCVALNPASVFFML